MKKVYKKGKIHPSSEVLSYLICFSVNLSSFPGNRKKNYGDGGSGFNGGDLIEHSTSFNYDCFRCYTSFWFRWDCSPNRQLIHEIIDAYENDNQLLSTDKKKKMRKIQKDRKKKGSIDTNTATSSNNDNEVVILEMIQFEQVSEEIFDSFEIINGVGDTSENDDDDNVVIEEVKTYFLKMV
ncbi:hypothetical protein MKX01_030387 [Papaver californicum]|nr:hypothetical protein MKX01_030387 [Papaver californicum]